MATMQPIDLSCLKFPGVIIKGQIYESLEPDVLLQDLLEVELPNGDIIDAGWYPEHDRAGRFRIRISKTGTHEEYIATNPFLAVEIVRELLLQHYEEK